MLYEKYLGHSFAVERAVPSKINHVRRVGRYFSVYVYVYFRDGFRGSAMFCWLTRTGQNLTLCVQAVRKVYHKTFQEKALLRSCQEITKVLFRNYKLHKAMDEHNNCTRHTSMYPRTMSRMSQHPQWEDGAGLSLLYH